MLSNKKLLFEEAYKTLRCNLIGYAVKVLNYKREDALDAVSDVYLKLWVMLINDNQHRTLLQIKGFLYICLRNKYKNNIRLSLVKQRYTILTAYSEDLCIDVCPLDELGKNECKTVIKEVLYTLPRDRKSIVTLFLADFSNRQIADGLNLSMSTVKTQKVRFQASVKKKLLAKGLGD